MILADYNVTSWGKQQLKLSYCWMSTLHGPYSNHDGNCRSYQRRFFQYIIFRDGICSRGYRDIQWHRTATAIKQCTHGQIVHMTTCSVVDRRRWSWVLFNVHAGSIVPRDELTFTRTRRSMMYVHDVHILSLAMWFAILVTVSWSPSGH